MDRRTDRTRRALVDAVRSLLVARAWGEVMVQLICDTADVSRSAFYAHFDGRDDVLDTAFEALLDALGEPIAGRGLDARGTFACLAPLTSHVREHRALVERNAAAPSGATLSVRFRETVVEAARREARRSGRFRALPDETIAFATGGALALLERWRAGGCVASEAAVLKTLDGHVGTVLDAASVPPDA